ncbi:MAG: GNAT family N-acetyltransferase [Gammaproteobacteria bacterium]|nr:GNAT family N-acetyltransferase [Gammaproteobacteria bacterium]
MSATAVVIRRLQTTDNSALLRYFCALSHLTRSRFGPHPFDKQTVTAICNHSYDQLQGWIGIDPASDRIIAYLVVKPGYLHFEEERYRSYGLLLNHDQDYTLAPSVADDWQSSGVGSVLMAHVLSELEQRGQGQIVLWGGVQAGNTRACQFYRKFGFRQLGEFEHNGLNYDMIRQFGRDG